MLFPVFTGKSVVIVAAPLIVGVYEYHSPTEAPAPLGAHIGSGISVPSTTATVWIPGPITEAVRQVSYAFIWNE